MSWKADYVELRIPNRLYEKLYRAKSRQHESPQLFIEQILRDYLEMEEEGEEEE